MTPEPAPHPVVVTDVRIPFWSMVVFMVKWAIAAIPAVVILVAIATGVAVIGTTLRTAWDSYQSSQSSRASSGRPPETPRVARAPKAAQDLTRSERECAAAHGVSGPAYEAC